MTYACHGGDDDHADVSDEKHHGREYVDVDISKGILDAQVDEAVSHRASLNERKKQKKHGTSASSPSL